MKNLLQQPVKPRLPTLPSGKKNTSPGAVNTTPAASMRQSISVSQQTPLSHTSQWGNEESNNPHISCSIQASPIQASPIHASPIVSRLCFDDDCSNSNTLTHSTPRNAANDSPLGLSCTPQASLQASIEYLKYPKPFSVNPGCQSFDEIQPADPVSPMPVIDGRTVLPREVNVWTRDLQEGPACEPYTLVGLFFCDCAYVQMSETTVIQGYA